MVNNQAIAFHRDLYKITTFTGWIKSGADFIQSQTMAKKTSCLMVFQIGCMKASVMTRKNGAPCNQRDEGVSKP